MVILATCRIAVCNCRWRLRQMHTRIWRSQRQLKIQARITQSPSEAQRVHRSLWPSLGHWTIWHTGATTSGGDGQRAVGLCMGFMCYWMPTYDLHDFGHNGGLQRAGYGKLSTVNRSNMLSVIQEVIETASHVNVIQINRDQAGNAHCAIFDL